MALPAATVTRVPTPQLIVLPGRDAPFMRPHQLVQPEDPVRAGQPLVQDRRQPEIALIAPVAGRIKEVLRGPQRRVESVSLVPDLPTPQTDAPQTLPTDPAQARQVLVRAGFWPAIRSRPFDGIAAVTATPRTVLVTGFLSDPLAPPLAQVLTPDQTSDLSRGLRTLATVADAPVVMVHDGDPPLTTEGITLRRAGHLPQDRTPGTLVARVGPATPDRPVWLLDWQDAAALGHWLRTGALPGHRLLSCRVAGERGLPRLLSADIGTPVQDILTALSLPAGPVLAGPPEMARAVIAIGRRDDRLSVPRTLLPAARRANRPGPVLPLPRLERTLPRHPAPIALLRAIAAGDDDAARRLGVLDLAPEDLAASALHCLSGNDYPALLAQMLDRIREDET